MNIENSYGFRSAQAAWENANPFDSECTCAEDVLFVCDECGQHGYTDEDAADDAREHDREARLGY